MLVFQRGTNGNMKSLFFLINTGHGEIQNLVYKVCAVFMTVRRHQIPIPGIDTSVPCLQNIGRLAMKPAKVTRSSLRRFHPLLSWPKTLALLNFLLIVGCQCWWRSGWKVFSSCLYLMIIFSSFQNESLPLCLAIFHCRNVCFFSVQRLTIRCFFQGKTCFHPF